MAQADSPRVSVIIPVYNGTDYLGEAIESVFTQTYTDYEIIVVDDGSTDETWPLIQSYGSRLRGIHKENGGIASALNCGIQQARGEYIVWLSHDDMFLPHKLERQVTLMDSSPNLGGCYSDYYIVNAEGRVVSEKKMPHYPAGEMVRHLLQYMFINGCTVLVRRACFEAEGLFDDRLPFAQDADMWFRLLRRFVFAHIPESLTKYRVHAGQGSQKIKRIRADAHEFWRRCLEDYPLTDIFPELRGREDDKAAVAKAHNCLGDIMRICHADMPLARGQYIHSLQIWPNLRNRALPRAIMLQFWLPNPTWIIVRRLVAWQHQSSRVPEEDLSAIKFSNIVRCSIS